MAKKEKRKVTLGNAYIKATFNNTIVTITDTKGNTIAWSSAGANGFKSARKSTPHAAQITSEKVSEIAKEFGLEKIIVFIKGPGPGRESALRALGQNFSVDSIHDVTPIPFNGCKRPKKRRV